MPLSIFVNDYAGHPFTLELSRSLADRGHSVSHCYSADVEGAKADFDGAGNIAILPIGIGHKVRKYQFVGRYLDERDYGHAVATHIGRVKPDVVLSANTPLDALKLIQPRTRSFGVRHVLWLQDMIGQAADRYFSNRYFGFGRLIANRFLALEASIAGEADHIVSICEAFLPYLVDYGVDVTKVSVIPNWAPLEEIPQTPKVNDWRSSHVDETAFVFLYAGTLGLKHNPNALLALARAIQKHGFNAKVVVVSEGLGADWLRQSMESEDISALSLFPYQPFSELPAVLGAADVLISLLEPDAGEFSVPSKILSYLCAGRAQLAAMPIRNLASQTIQSAGCGKIVAPGDDQAFVEAAIQFIRSPESELAQFGINARRYAEQNFDIQKISEQFERVLEGNAIVI